MALARRAPTAGPQLCSTREEPCLECMSYQHCRELSVWATLGPSSFLSSRKPLSWSIYGSWLVRLCFQALLSTVCLQLPVFPHVPFLACDLACSVCTVQIKVVSIIFFHCDFSVFWNGLLHAAHCQLGSAQLTSSRWRHALWQGLSRSPQT